MKLITVHGNESGSNNSMINNRRLYKISIDHIVSFCEFDYSQGGKKYIGTEMNLINNTIFVEESMKQVEKLIFE